MTTAQELLREHDLRVTAARVAVLEVLDERSHLTTAEVTAAVRERIGTLSTQAGYQMLDALVAAGLVRCIELPGGPSRYERLVGDNHHHLVCRSCGAVVDSGCPVRHAPCVEPDDPHGFEVYETEIVFWGVCPACLAGRRVPTGQASSAG
jgi:Fe2+ or Zn2+ uptake regulation protein